MNKILKIFTVILIVFAPIKMYSVTTIGAKSSNFTYSDSKSTSIKVQSYSYSLTITQSMSLQITATLTPIVETLTNKNLHLYLTKDGNVINNLYYTMHEKRRNVYFNI